MMTFPAEFHAESKSSTENQQNQKKCIRKISEKKSLFQNKILLKESLSFFSEKNRTSKQFCYKPQHFEIFTGAISSFFHAEYILSKFNFSLIIY